MGSKVENGSGRASGGWPHSENQRAGKYRRDMGRGPFGNMDKDLKAASREERIRRSNEEFAEEQALKAQQVRAIEHGVQHGLQYLFGVNVTQQCVEEILGREEIKDEFNTPNGNHFTITIVDLGRTKFPKVA